MLVQNEGRELTPEAIYEHVWETAMNIDTGLVRKHISQIKKKLDEENTNDFSIQTEYGRGYVFTIE